MAFHKQSILRNPRKNRVVVLEDLNFFWDEPELKELPECWELGGDVRLVALHFDRDPDEVLMALIHLARKDKITRRKGGLLLES
ncbi:hypothetical protein [Cytobacillus praedii]|uniref:Uncharacterized protein n=1 Tax=Cytobacillus praedii TaxID=1742358 RepID=A0A4R1ANE9_9BACI|nr:hypothetical protein [Cytobacillus praedii]TCJ01345.1 hypothetical protein E0Y62_24530 [Cytobacillus praedii]